MLSGLWFHFFPGIVVDRKLFDFKTISFVVNIMCHTSNGRLGNVSSSLLVLMVVWEWNLRMALIRRHFYALTHIDCIHIVRIVCHEFFLSLSWMNISGSLHICFLPCACSSTCHSLTVASAELLTYSVIVIRIWMEVVSSPWKRREPTLLVASLVLKWFIDVW
jgi:hypothetical protein